MNHGFECDDAVEIRAEKDSSLNCCGTGFQQRLVGHALHTRYWAPVPDSAAPEKAGIERSDVSDRCFRPVPPRPACGEA